MGNHKSGRKPKSKPVHGYWRNRNWVKPHRRHVK